MLEKKTIGKPCAGKPHARFEQQQQSYFLIDLPLLYCLKISGKRQPQAGCFITPKTVNFVVGFSNF